MVLLCFCRLSLVVNVIMNNSAIYKAFAKEDFTMNEAKRTKNWRFPEPAEKWDWYLKMGEMETEMEAFSWDRGGNGERDGA